MAEHHQVQYENTVEETCVDAFKTGEKDEAVQLLAQLPPKINAADVRTNSSVLLFTKDVTLLHLAAYHGWKGVVRDLVNTYKCKVEDCDSSGRTALHYAAIGGSLETTQCLIMELGCDPSSTTKEGFADTPLHKACRSDHADIVLFLLSLTEAESQVCSQNKYGFTPLDYAPRGSDSSKILMDMQQSQQSFTKVMLTGNSAAGKSSLAQVITRIATRSAMASVRDKITSRKVEVECLTAGIIPFQIESDKVGNMVLYDLAGHPEFYSSHFAVMENAMERSAAIFINMVDLSKSEEEITREILYWLYFTEIATCKVEEKSCVLMVGSHADLLNKAQLEHKSTLVTELVQSRSMKMLEYMGFVALDCRQVDSIGVKVFVSLLSKSQQTIAARAPVMNFHCRLLYAFLRTKLKKIAYKLEDLTHAVTNLLYRPSETHLLSDHLVSLSDIGLIIFLKNPEKSWVVVEKEALLKEVNGTLFCSSKHRQIASNTGIVPLSSLEELLPKHDTEMLVGFLEILEFCHPVPDTIMDTITNLNSATPASPLSCVSSTARRLLFFPSLVQVERPEVVTKGKQLSFGWCLGCKNPYQFFTPRFLHVLLLNVAFKYPLKSENIPTPLDGLERQCFVWKNGISWTDSDNIRTVVELIGQDQWVVLAMSHSKERPVEHAKLRSALIGLVVHLQQEHCPGVDTCECLISPFLLQQYPFDKLPDTDLFAVKNVARSILLHKPSIRSFKDGSGGLPTNMLSTEPYYLLSPSSVCQLMDPNMAEQAVPAALLQEVRKHCKQPQLNPEPPNHNSLKACVDKLSIFCGRNPLEVAGLNSDDVLNQVLAPVPSSPGDPSYLLSTRSSDPSSSPIGHSSPHAPSFGGNLIPSTPTYLQGNIISQILRDNYHSLYRIMSNDILDITGSLYSRYFVDEDTRSFVTTATGVSDLTKAHKVVENCTQNILIHQHPVDRLKELLDILRNTQPAAKPVADRILEKCTQASASDTSSSVLPSTTSSSVLPSYTLSSVLPSTTSSSVLPSYTSSSVLPSTTSSSVLPSYTSSSVLPSTTSWTTSHEPQQHSYQPPPQPSYELPPPPPLPAVPSFSGPRYKALYDYTACGDEEVSFVRDDIIIDTTMIADGSWMEGRVERTGKYGMLPSHYVEKI